jgi:hypothetical protein
MGVANTAQPKLSPGHPLAGAFLRVLMLAHKQAHLPRRAHKQAVAWLRASLGFRIDSATAKHAGRRTGATVEPLNRS